jgi:hypothetical protein
MSPDRRHNLISGGIMFGSATKIPHARACRFQGARINLLERRFSALPDNDHIATLVRWARQLLRRRPFVLFYDFNSAPSGSSPVSTYRQSAIKSLRATATIVMRRIRPRPVPTLSWNQRERAERG